MYRSSNLIEERNNFIEDSRDLFLINALYNAVMDGDLTTIGFLLENKKVNPNHVLLDYDAAPLHTATGIGTEGLATQIVQMLLTYGADPNIVTSDGTTPLMIACIFGRLNVAKLLLKYGSNPLIEDCDCMNAIEYAFENGCALMQEVLNNYNCEWSVLESSDGSLIDERELTKKFISIFNDDLSSKSSYVMRKKTEFSDIESDANCVQFCALNTAFRESVLDDSISSAQSFYSVANKDILRRSMNNEEVFDEDSNDSEISGFAQSSKRSSINCSEISYRTDRIKLELNRHKINHGPITASTKKVYYNLIKKVIKGKRKGPFDLDEFSNFPEVLRSTLKNNVKEVVLKWSHLESSLCKNFSSGDRLWRGGKEKQFFTYLLLDPFITNDLPLRKADISELEIWKTFLLSIFYIGKGKNSRPFSHLYEACRSNLKRSITKKIRRIQNIWDNSAGVICLHIFHNVISAEAHTREAAMIDAIGLSNLTNIQSGEYYGIAKNWSMKQKQQLGIVLLSKALEIYLAEGERQIFPADLK